MTLKDRVLIVLRGSDRPLASWQIARILGVDTQRVCSPLSRLQCYGIIERVDRETDAWGRNRGVYRVKGAT